MGEACRFQGSPEPVPRSGEMMARRSGIKTGIDAAEEHREIARDQIRHCPVDRRPQLLTRRPLQLA
jgi:hypothetical protein